MRVNDKDLKQAVKDKKLDRAEAWELSDLRAEERRWTGRVEKAQGLLRKSIARGNRINDLEIKAGIREAPTATEPGHHPKTVEETLDLKPE